ncbi:MAG: hypothetical protein HFG02_09885 [Oscillibacter sp.]|nr:hypothetical protein [Oscillibacter sp.]
MNTMNNTKNEKQLTRWLLIATIVLLALVLALQLWQMFGPKAPGGHGSQTPEPELGAAAPAATEPLAAGVSPGKAAMIEDVQALNPELSFDSLAALSAGELEQLWEAGAPGLPIGASAAAVAAEEYAGTLEMDSVTSQTDPELDESPAHYEVELRHPTMGEFTYKVDAYTGEVLEGTPGILQSLQAANATVPAAPEGERLPASGAAEAQKPASAAAEPAKPAAKSQTPASDAPASGEEAAKAAAFTHAGVSAADATSVLCKLDWDDGRQVYDIEFWVGGTEYDYEVDASTSVVLKAEQERNNRPAGTSGQQQAASFIGEEAAKTAALTHAGVSAADAGYVKWELDEDDGRWVYEVEFRVGAVEYDYEIAANDGAVLKAKQDS